MPQVAPNAEELQRLKRGGVDSIRIPVSWGSIQPTRRGGFDWSSTDAFIAAAVKAQIEVFPFLSTAPTWAVPVDRRFGSPETLPVRTGPQRSGWTAVRHPGGRCAMGRTAPSGPKIPSLPERPVHTWQIWNEPNFKYFVAQPDPADYGKLVKLSTPQSKRPIRAPRSSSGGLFARPIEATFQCAPPQAYFASEFLEQMYKSTPGIKSKFRGYALHPYTGSYKNLPRRIEEVRRVLKRQPRRRQGPLHHRARLELRTPATAQQLRQRRRRSGAGTDGGLPASDRTTSANGICSAIFWFSIGDYAGLCNFCGGSGLFRSGFKPKPAWNAYVQFAGGRP